MRGFSSVLSITKIATSARAQADQIFFVASTTTVLSPAPVSHSHRISPGAPPRLAVSVSSCTVELLTEVPWPSKMLLGLLLPREDWSPSTPGTNLGTYPCQSPGGTNRERWTCPTARASTVDEHLRLGSTEQRCPPVVQVTLCVALLKPVAALFLLGFKAPPPSRLIFLLVRNLPKVWGHFLLHSSPPKVQVLCLPLLIPCFPLCPAALHGRVIVCSEV